MLQGSLYETLMRKINRPYTFSYLLCVHIILSGGPSNAPSFFILTLEYLLNLFCTIVRSLFLPHHLFCFRTNFLLSNIFLFYPSCPFFSAIIFNTTSSRVPIYLLLKYCISNQSCTIVILNCAPSGEPTNNFFTWSIILLCYIAISQRVNSFLPLRAQA